jgi:hypothetical protein
MLSAIDDDMQIALNLMFFQAAMQNNYSHSHTRNQQAHRQLLF